MLMIRSVRLVYYTVGNHTISTRKMKLVHFERSVHLGTNLSKCMESNKVTFWINQNILQDQYILEPI